MNVAFVVEQQVRRLHVPVDDAVPVRPVDRHRNLLEPGERRLARYPRVPHALVDGPTLEALHDDERPPLVLGDVEHGHDVRRSREPSGGERLASESGPGVLLARVAVREHLDGDRSLEDGIGRAVHLSHPATRRRAWARRTSRKHVGGDHKFSTRSAESLTLPAAEQEAVAQRVFRVEREDVLARPIRAALDLGDHRRDAGDFGSRRHGQELAADDAAVDRAPRHAAAARRSSSASRADVPLPHGERSTSPSANTVTLRCVSGLSASSCKKITP